MRKSTVAVALAATTALAGVQGAAAQSFGQPYAQPATAQGGVRTGLNFLGCNGQGGTGQGVGAVVGGLAGAFAGNKIDGGRKRTAGTILGALAGAAVGSAVGCRLQTASQARAQAAADQAVYTGQTQTWRGDDGSYGQARVVSTEYQGGGFGQPVLQPRPVSLDGLRLAPGVALTTQLEAAPYAQVTANSTANLRAGPSTSQRIVGRLTSGQTYDAIAKVQGQPWIMVGRGGEGLGYVSDTVVRGVGGATAGASVQTAGNQESGPLCRVIEQTINAQTGGTATDRYRACRDAQGAWTLQRV